MERLRSAEREVFSRLEIFERDGWVCGICSTPIDPGLKWPARMCGVIDHVIPVLHGGAHLRSNVQAAHNLCNARKGARVETPMEVSDGS